MFKKNCNILGFMEIIAYKIQPVGGWGYSRGARDSKIGKKWPESSRILDFILS